MTVPVPEAPEPVEQDLAGSGAASDATEPEANVPDAAEPDGSNPAVDAVLDALDAAGFEARQLGAYGSAVHFGRGHSGFLATKRLVV